ncbi:MAG: hypothetical protein IJ087_14720 [Eggerthellaceae bacterium]|nr:hypothetical protein [Eggerthellaceae bacterium]
MPAPSSNRVTSSRKRSPWYSTAFIVESVLLLVFLAASLAVLTLTFSSALNRSVASRTSDAAVIAASSIAEHFAANPSDVQDETVLGDLRIVCTVTDEARAGGTMHRAHIDVFDMNAAADAAPTYSLDTSRYESEVS